MISDRGARSIDNLVPRHEIVDPSAQSATWAAEACEQIPRRVIVRSYVACCVTRPEDYSLDYSLEECSAFGLHELVHSGLKRAMAAILDREFLQHIRSGE